MSVYGYYTGGEDIGMDHPLFMARMQARTDAVSCAMKGVPLAETLQVTRTRMRELFGDVPLAMVDAVVVQAFAQHAADLELKPGPEWRAST